MKDELASKLLGTVTIVGVGDTRQGDDGAGPMVAGLLAEAGVPRVIDAGVSPELETWRIRELAAETVLFVDAVDFGKSPGDAAVLEPADLRASGFDTHRAPLRLTMEYLQTELKCRCYLLAIQPKHVRLGSPMCEEVSETAARIAGMLSQILLISA